MHWYKGIVFISVTYCIETFIIIIKIIKMQIVFCQGYLWPHDTFQIANGIFCKWSVWFIEYLVLNISFLYILFILIDRTNHIEIRLLKKRNVLLLVSFNINKKVVAPNLIKLICIVGFLGFQGTLVTVC